MDTIHQLTLVHIAMLQIILPEEQVLVHLATADIITKTQMVQQPARPVTQLTDGSRQAIGKAAHKQSAQQGNTEAVQAVQDAQVTHINQTTTSQVQAAALVGQMK